MSTRRLVVIGLITFAILSLAVAPASLLLPLANRLPGIAVTGLDGTVWRGSAIISYQGLALGQLRFVFAPGDMLRSRLGYDIDLTGALVTAHGRAAAGISTYDVHADGSIDLAVLRDLQARYYLAVPGQLRFEGLSLVGNRGIALPNARGEVRWTGGEVSYQLGGRAYRAVLPELAGFLDSDTGHPQMSVYAPGATTPLLMTHVTPDGMVSVGITKQFTKLIGQPWIGSEPDHAVVLEVAEKLF